MLVKVDVFLQLEVVFLLHVHHQVLPLVFLRVSSMVQNILVDKVILNGDVAFPLGYGVEQSVAEEGVSECAQELLVVLESHFALV